MRSNVILTQLRNIFFPNLNLRPKISLGVSLFILDLFGAGIISQENDNSQTMKPKQRKSASYSTFSFSNCNHVEKHLFHISENL